jgi:hypothetical protein
MGSDIGITAGDAVVSYSFIAGNNATFGSPTLAATGVTFGTVSENPATEGTTTTGYDCEASASTALPSAGPSSAAAVVGWTLSVAQTGMSNLNRIRETVNYALTANGLEITPVLANPVLSQNHALSASSAELATTPSLASPALTQNHTFIVNALTVGTPELGTPALSSYFNYSLTADAITIGTPGMGIPAISQNHAFTSIELAITPTLDGPAIAQIHALTANGPLVTPALGIPTLTQVHSLTASGIEAAPALGSPAITQYHFLTTANFTIGAPVIDEAMWSFPPSGPDDSEILLRKILIDTKWFRMVKN